MAKDAAQYDPLHEEPVILDFWRKQKIYEKAKEKIKDGPIWYFLDGPPYTSGRVHLGTAWNKSLKDAILRFKRMSGFKAWDRAGYDMHGLPTEHATEKKLGLNGKDDIVKYGVAKFIEACENLCLENMEVMNQDFMRLGVWMDFDNAYQSIKKEFVEGEWWLIKKAHENNRLYEGLRTMTWCASCATATAKHELEYKEVRERSIFVKFPVVGQEKTFLVIWTTTPWTIPFNLAVMVNPELDYVKANVEGETWILSKALGPMVVQAVAGKKYEQLEVFKGEDLEGLKYRHPFHDKIKFFEEQKDNPKLHTVLLSAEYVDTSAGSGLVHCAPGCGPEDYEVGHENGLPPFNKVNEKGIFEDIGEFDGLKAKDDDKKFIEALDRTGLLIECTDVDHDYAHCWRCHNPVIYRTTKQWFFKTEDLKEKMIKENDNITWVPTAAYNAFNSWLMNLRDNSITKQRFWGTPIPVWKCSSCEKYIVLSTVKEIEEASGQKLRNLHKPWIDEITIPCECGEKKERIPDILDVWVDAGCASWNCLDFPHRTDLFETMFPADFILEGKDQIRGWFNLLMVASMISMGKPSFKNVYMHGFVQDAQGRKMSKSLGNYILPGEVIEKYGADTLRYYMIGGTQPGTDINYNFDDLRLKNRNLTILWNVHKFLLDLAVQAGKNPLDLDETLMKGAMSLPEHYIFSVMNTKIKQTTTAFNMYAINEVPWRVEELFLELSRDYIQLVREKAAQGEQTEREVVLYTLHEVMLNTLKLFAPIIPMASEMMYQNLRDAFGYAEESIHLTAWPSSDENAIDDVLESSMAVQKIVIQSILAGREKVHLGVRWPLQRVIVATRNDDVKSSVDKLKHLILTQTNVKQIEFVDSLPNLKMNVKVNSGKIGAVFTINAPAVLAKLASENMEKVLAKIDEDGLFKFKDGGKEFDITKDMLNIQREVPQPFIETAFRGGWVYLDTTRTAALESEGYSRELMRRIQSIRKDMGLIKSDRVTVFIKAIQEGVDMIIPWQDAIQEKVGADILKISANDPAKKHDVSEEIKVKNTTFGLHVSRS